MSLDPRDHAAGDAVSPSVTPDFRSDRHGYPFAAPPKIAFNYFSHRSHSNSKGTQRSILLLKTVSTDLGMSILPVHFVEITIMLFLFAAPTVHGSSTLTFASPAPSVSPSRYVSSFKSPSIHVPKQINSVGSSDGNTYSLHHHGHHHHSKKQYVKSGAGPSYLLSPPPHGHQCMFL